MSSMTGMFWGFDIAASGLRAELQRAEVVAANLANMHVSRGPNGEPYRRKSVVFEEALRQAGMPSRGIEGDGFLAAGVRVDRVYEDHKTPFVEIYDPGHPHANAEGFVLLSNVDVFREMVDMSIIERSFQANLAALRAYRGMLQNTLANFR